MKLNKLTPFAVCVSLLTAASASVLVFSNTDFSSTSSLVIASTLDSDSTAGLWYTGTNTDLAITDGAITSFSNTRRGMSTVISTTQLASTTSDQNLLRVTFDYGQSYASEDLYLHVMGFSDNGSNSTPTSVLINNNSGNGGLTWSTTATMDDYDVTNLKDGSAMGTDRSWDTGYGVEFLNQGTGLTAEFDVDFSAYDYITVSFARSLGTTGFTLDNIKIEAVPEPSSVALLGLGSLALVTRRKR